MKKIYNILIFIGLYHSLFAQNGIPPMGGARGTAMGGASVTFLDINSIFVNQAGLGFLETLTFAAQSEVKFIGANVPSSSFGVAYPNAKIGTFGLMFNQFGINAFNQQKIGLSYARKLAKNFSLGVQLDYLGTRIPDYGQSNSVTVELGFVVKLLPTLNIAAHTYNPVRVKLPNGDHLPTLINIGIAYLPSEQLTITGEVEKNIDYQLSAKMGIEYRPVKAFAIRAGARTAPFQASFGMGLNWQGLQVDVSSSYHQILGFTPGLTLIYGLKGKPKA